MTDREFSDYIVYVDESGDHSLSSIDPQYPIFVLAFCIFNKQSYTHSLVQKFKQVKFEYFGHDMVVLHENEIRKDKGAFRLLRPKEVKDEFVGRLSRIIEEEEFTVIAAVIRKDKLAERYLNAGNPYHLALAFCMERTYRYLEEHGATDKNTHIVVERRGKREDDTLELEFRRICDGMNYFGKHLPFEIVMAHKQSNSAGLQLADLTARPIGRYILNKQQGNRAFDIIKKKMRRDNWGKIEGYGLKIFP